MCVGGRPVFWVTQQRELLCYYPVISSWRSASWLTYLWIMCFLRGHSGHVWWMALQKPGQLASLGFPLCRLQTAPGESPPLSRSLGVINHQCGAFSPHTAVPTNSQYMPLAQLRPLCPLIWLIVNINIYRRTNMLAEKSDLQKKKKDSITYKLMYKIH